MGFFKNKLNVFLVVVLTSLVVVAVVLGIKFFNKPVTTVVDFSNMSESEIIAWASDNGFTDKVEIKHEFDEEIEKGKVIYQSIKPGEEIGDSLIIIISDGKDETGLIEIPKDKLSTYDDALNWFNDNKFTNVKYISDDSSELDDGKIISIDPLKAKPDDQITVKYAGKALIKVPDFSSYSVDKLKTWANENSISVEYKYISSEKPKDTILDQSVTSGNTISSGSKLVITLSNGDNKKTATIPGTYLGIEEEKFLKTLKDLGFTNFIKDEMTYFSTKSAKGTIFSYDDGTFPIDQKINYAISAGKYEYTKGDFEDKSVTTVKSLIEDLNKRNAHITLKTTSKTSSSHTKGNVYDCSSEFSNPNTTISCSLSGTEEDAPKKAYIDPYKYLGYSESKFIKALNDLGFKNLKKETAITSKLYAKDTVCYYLPDGDVDTSKTIVYKLSLGSSDPGYVYTFDANEYNEKTLAVAQSVIDAYNKKGAGISLTYTEKETNNHKAGNLYDCSYSNKTVSCKLAVEKEEEPVVPPTPVVKEDCTIMSAETYQQIAASPAHNVKSFDDAKSFMTSQLSNAGFTNFTFNSIDTGDSGTILKISVNGSESYDTSKTYKSDVIIIVYIVE